MESTTTKSDYRLELAVFICGAVVMIFELVGSRLLGPFVGTSLYSWTGLIGVILASLSLGYYLGGRMADRHADLPGLGLIIAGAGVLIGLTALIKDAVSFWITSMVERTDLATVILSFLLFAPAALLLGIVSPYAAKLRVKDLGVTGQSVGNLYALSTLGSIAGTFLAGFVIIPRVGSTLTAHLLVVTLFATSLMLAGRDLFRRIGVGRAVLVVALFAAATVITMTSSRDLALQSFEFIDTPYNRAMIFRSLGDEARVRLNLMLDPHGVQGAIYLDGTGESAVSYIKYYRLIRHFHEAPTRTLMLGGGTYLYPREFFRDYPESTMKVVEIDPGMTKIARSHFGLEDDSRMEIIHEDARTFLNRNEEKFDALFVDAFNSGSSVPFHLTTVETMRHMYDALEDDGVILANTISAITGDRGMFLRAQVATLKEVFPQVLIFPIQKSADPAALQNVLLVALKSPDAPPLTSDVPELQDMLAHLWIGELADDMPVLTDDYAPIEYYKNAAL